MRSCGGNWKDVDNEGTVGDEDCYVNFFYYIRTLYTIFTFTVQ